MSGSSGRARGSTHQRSKTLGKFTDFRSSANTFEPAQSPAVAFQRSESPHECGTSIDFNRWLRIRVAFGVLSRLPASTGDHLASLRGFIRGFLSGNPATWTAQPNPARRPGGGLIGMFAFRRALHGFHLFHHPRTLRFGWKRRLPPARERLAKHSGDGSGRIVGMGLEGGDDDEVKLLETLRWDDELSTGQAWKDSIGRRPPPTPLCPAGNLPLKGGDRPEARSWQTKSLEIAELHFLPASCPCTNQRGTAEQASFDLPP